MHRAVKDQRRLPDVELEGLVPEGQKECLSGLRQGIQCGDQQGDENDGAHVVGVANHIHERVRKNPDKGGQSGDHQRSVVFPKWYGFGTRALGMRISSVIRPSSWTATARFHRSLRRCRFLPFQGFLVVFPDGAFVQGLQAEAHAADAGLIES